MKAQLAASAAASPSPDASSAFADLLNLITDRQDLERDATDDSEKSHPRGELESREGGGTYPRPSFG
jgi:hypothetical protein